MKVLFTGGGSGGHIVPIIAIARELRKIRQKDDIQFSYLGPKDNFGSIFLSHEGIKIRHVLAGKVRRYINLKSVLQNIFDIVFKIPLGIIQSFFYIFFLSPDLVFSKGGFGSIPVVIAAKILWVPIFLHESDVVPGVANKFLSRWTSKILVSFPRTEHFPLNKMVLVGNPVRKEVLGGSKQEAKESFKLNSGKPVVLILGGSQGAQRINDNILEILPSLLDSFEVIHQSGENNFQQVKSEAKAVMRGEELSYHLIPFFKEPELRKAYAASDIIIGRAGSGSIFEIAALGKPSILIPLSQSAQNHQVKNAYAYAENGACIVMEETNFTSHFFLERLKTIFANTENIEKMKAKATEFSKPEAANTIANYLLQYLLK